MNDDLDADAKTTAFNIADMGLEEDEATVSVEAEAIRARIPAPAPRAAAPAARAPAPAPRPAPRAPVDEEKTTAFNLADLPPEDDVRPAPSTLVSAKPGAAVRGGAAPARRNETLALAPAAARAAVQAARAPAPSFDEEKTSALSLDDIERIDAAPARPAKPAARAPAQIDEGERTVAVSLDDAIAAVDAAPPKKSSVVKSSQQAPQALKAPRAAPSAQDEKTTAMSLDDIEAIDAAPAPVRAVVAAAKVPAKATAAKAAGAKKLGNIDLGASEGFIGAIGYAFKHGAIEQQGGQLDPDRKSAGFRNLIVVGGALAALMLVFGIVW